MVVCSKKFALDIVKYHHQNGRLWDPCTLQQMSFVVFMVWVLRVDLCEYPERCDCWVELHKLKWVKQFVWISSQNIYGLYSRIVEISGGCNTSAEWRQTTRDCWTVRRLRLAIENHARLGNSGRHTSITWPGCWPPVYISISLLIVEETGNQWAFAGVITKIAIPCLWTSGALKYYYYWVVAFICLSVLFSVQIAEWANWAVSLIGLP